jgi:hypothetical protein
LLSRYFIAIPPLEQDVPPEVEEVDGGDLGSHASHSGPRLEGGGKTGRLPRTSRALCPRWRVKEGIDCSGERAARRLVQVLPPRSTGEDLELEQESYTRRARKG